MVLIIPTVSAQEKKPGLIAWSKYFAPCNQTWVFVYLLEVFCSSEGEN